MKFSFEKITNDNRRPGMPKNHMLLVRYDSFKFGWRCCRTFKTVPEAKNFITGFNLLGLVKLNQDTIDAKFIFGKHMLVENINSGFQAIADRKELLNGDYLQIGDEAIDKMNGGKDTETYILKCELFPGCQCDNCLDGQPLWEDE